MYQHKTLNDSLWALPALFFLFNTPAVQADAPVIVITPTRIATTVTESTIPVEVISRAQIENSAAQDVADIIKFHSGIEIARNGGSGQVTSLFMRGAESNHTVILVDGIKINPATIGSAALQNISPSMIDHIEIVKGPRSALYGSDAIGGVINIITRKSVDGMNTAVTVSAGDNASQRRNVNLAYGNGALFAGLMMERYNTDGFPTNDASTEDHGYDNDTINTFIHYKYGNNALNLRHWQSSGNVEYYAFGEKNQDFENSATALQWNGQLSSRLDLTLTLSQLEDRIEQQVANFLADFDYARTRRNSLDAKIDYRASDQTILSMGGIKSIEKVDALSFGTLIDADTSIGEFFVLVQTAFDEHQITLAARNTDHEDFGTHNTWNIDYRYQLDRVTRIYAGIGSAFRAPDTTDRFGFIGNTDLSPETSRNVEIGMIFDLSPGSQFKLAAFNNQIDDLIEPNSSFSQMINIDQAEIRGIELGFKQQLQHWQYQFNAVLQDPLNVASGEKLSRRADSTFNILLGYQRGLWQFSSKTTLVSSRDNSSFDDITLPAYGVTDFSVQYQVARRASVKLKIDNLFNEDYETAAGYNNRERFVMVEFSLKFNQ